MTIKVISRKIREPELPHFHISRKVINSALEEAFEQNKKCTFLSAITGYGKTIAIRDFLQEQKIQNKFWYNLDEWDKDPVTFLKYLYQIFFIQNLISDDLEELLSQPLNNEKQLKNFIGLLSNELDENLKENCYLVIDNFQEVQEDETIQQILIFLLNYCPENLKIIILSQEPIPEIFSPFFLKNEIDLINFNALLLTEEEAKQLINKIEKNNQDLCTDFINISQKNISLFVLMAQKFEDRNSLEKYNENRLLKNSINLIISQIYKTLSEEIKDFINQILFLPKIIKEHLTLFKANNISDFNILLETGILIFNAEEADYSFNPVFIPYLTENFYNLEKEYQEKILNSLINSLTDSEPELLISILFKAKAFEKIMKVLKDSYDYYFRHYLYNTLEHLIKPLKEIFPEDKLLLYIQIKLYRLTGKLKNALELLSKITEEHKTEQIVLEEGICQAVGGYYDSAIKILSNLEKSNKLSLSDYLFLINALGISYMNLHQLELAKSTFLKAIELKDKLLFKHDLLRVYNNLGLVSTWLGDFSQALIAYEQAINLANQLKILPLSISYNNVAIIHNFQGEYDKAYQNCLKALEVIDKINNEAERVPCYLTLIECYRGLKNNYKIQECINYLDTTLEKWLTPISSALLFKLKALISVDNKEFEKAKENIFKAMSLRNAGEGDPNLLEYKLELAYIYYAEGSYQDAITELNNIEQGIKEGCHFFHLARVYVYQALSYLKLSETSKFETSKALALQLIEEKNYFKLALKLNSNTDKVITKTEKHPLKIYTFGELEVIRNEKSIAKKGWQGKNTKLLFVYLLLNKTGVSKEQIYNIFLTEGEKSRTSFHNLIKKLRELFGIVFSDSEIILFSNDLYRFNFSIDYWWDAAQFEYELKEANNIENLKERIEKTVEALKLYNGNFMEGLELESWILTTQEYYRKLAYKNFMEVCNYYLEQEKFEALLKVSSHFFNVDNCNESACKFKMQALIALERKNIALQVCNMLEKNRKKFFNDKPSLAFQVFKDSLFNNTTSDVSEQIALLADSNLKLQKEIQESKKIAQTLKQSNEQLSKLATSDGLTGIANRRHFDEILQREWSLLEKSKQPLSLILFDVDYFKKYNDHYGHQAGDECLIQIAQAGKKVVNMPTQLFARYGGEEFVAILSNTTQQEACLIAEKLNRAIFQLSIPHEKSEANTFVTISLGVSTFIPSNDKSEVELLSLADKALYESKRKGRNCYSVADIE